MLEKESFRIAVIGATGLVGKTMARVLEERSFPVSDFIPVATESSKHEVFDAFRKRWQVISLEEMSFESADICFFTAGEEVSREYVPGALKEGCL